MEIEQIQARCKSLKAEYEQAIVDKENAWVKYERARDYCRDIAVLFYAATDDLDRDKEYKTDTK